MNTPVNFEIARLLTYTDFNQKSVNIGYNIATKELSFDYPLEYMNQKAIAAPTIAEVLMWLYNKYKLWISVSHKRHPQGKHFAYNIKQANEINTYLWKHNSPTEAYEAAIEYTLNNLI